MALGALALLALVLVGNASHATPLDAACGGLNRVNSPNVGSGNNYLAAVAAVASDDAWAVGYYGPGGLTLTAHWDGSTWSVVPSPSPGSFGNYLLGAAAVTTNDVWAVGYSTGSNGASQTLVEHWNGSAWSVIPSPNAGVSASLRAVAVVGANDIWAAGNYVQTDTYTLIEHWNGSTWSVVASPNPGGNGDQIYSLAAVSVNDVWAVGNYPGAGILQPLAEHWNGTAWTIVPIPDGGTGYNYLRGVTAVASNDVWAVGFDYSTSNQTLVEHWNGSVWSIVPSPNPGTSGSYLTAVTALAAGNVWAVGYYIGPDSDRTLAEHWDGSAWSVVPSASTGPGQNDGFGVAAAGPADLWMVGNYVNWSNATEQTLTDHYSGPCTVQTSTPTTPTATPTPLPTICPFGAIQNGGFETGSFPPWVILGTNPVPTIVGGPQESGTYYAQLGTVSGPEPLGDSSIYQQITVPAGSSTLSYWWSGGTSDSIAYDWQDAYVTDTNGAILATIMHNCQTTSGWLNQTFDMTPYAGQTVRIEFLVHQDGFGDDTYMNLDDVTLLTPFCASPTATATGTPPTSTPTRTATATRTSTVTPTPTFCAVPSVIQNGGFETGSLPPWVVRDTNPPPVVTTAQAHSGTHSVLLGTVSGPEPNGNASIYQQITVPADGGVLSFWFMPGSADEIVFDFQDAYITDLNGNILAVVLHTNIQGGPWMQQLYNMAAFAGQTVRVEFLVSEDGFGDDTFMYVDDVQMLSPACGSPTPPTTGPSPTATPTLTATRTSTGTPTPTPCVAPGVLQNGGFETGSLAPWAIRDTNPPPAVSTAAAHTGSYSVLVGTVSGPEPNGDGSLYQQITVPAEGGVLSFWWNGYASPAITFDWQDAYITDLNGNILTTLMHQSRATNGWEQEQHDVSAYAGQTVRVEFLVHEDGFGDDTWMYVDDVQMLSPTCGSPTPPTTAPPSSTPTLLATTATATPIQPTPTATTSATAPPPGASPTLSPPAVTPTSTPCTISFSDVHPADYFYTPVTYLYCHGVIAGYGDGTFRPYSQTTRGQMVKIVVLGFQKSIATPAGGTYTFEDVPPAQPFFAHVETAAALQIVSGYTCGHAPAGPCVPPSNRPYFLPGANVTRGQLSKIDVVAAGWPLSNPATGSFEDVLPGTAFYRFVETAAARGVVSGYGCGAPPAGPCVPPGNRPYFLPANPATRGQIAKIVYQSILGALGASRR